MPIPFKCSACDYSSAAPEKYAGKRIKCPGCGGGISIPDPDAPAGGLELGPEVEPARPALPPEDPPDGDDAPAAGGRPRVRRRGSAARRFRPSARLELGRVIGQGFSVTFANIVPFGILSLIIYSPVLALKFFQIVKLRDGTLAPGMSTNLDFVGNVGLFVLGFVLAATVCFGTFEQLRGRHASVGESLRHGMGRLPRVLLLMVVESIIIVGAGVLGMGAAILLAGVIAAIMGPLALILVLPGAIPVIMVACMLWLAIPVAAVEQLGPIASIQRSMSLTSGCRWSIFAILLTFILMEFGVGIVIGLLFGGSSLTQLFALGFGLFMGLVRAVAAAIGYHDLRIGKEGVDSSVLAKVFE